MAAEESHAFPMVTGAEADGGLGFLFKWNMGWMNDTLKYLKEDPIYRKYHHDKLTFPMAYAFSENFILPLSHDEVVHGKYSLVNKMPGDYFWKFANLRLLRGYQMTTPGKKLSFMGNEFGQFIEWNFKQGLDWLLLDYEMHRKMLDYTRDLNKFYLDNPALWIDDGSWNGYQWIQPDDADNGILAWRRIDPRTKRELIVVMNVTPVTRKDFRLGVPKAGLYEPVFCSDDLKYGGTGSMPGEVKAEKVSFREYRYSALFHIAPMSITVFKRKTPKKAAE
jgi:1,4-alpha-glucan branching enzyme